MAASRARVTCVVNQKGGVGKTTTAVNLAASIAAAEKRTLLVDMDPQGNASSGVGVRPNTRERTIYDVLIGASEMHEVIVETEVPHLSVAPATQDLVAAELELVDDPQRALKLREGLASVLADYDHIFIDCPPSLGLLTVNAMAACEAVLVPLQCEYYALEGLTHLMATIDRIKNGMNPKLEVEGVVLTMFDPRNNLAHQVAEEVKKHFFVFENVIPRNVRLSEAPSHGKPAMLYDVSSKGAPGLPRARPRAPPEARADQGQEGGSRAMSGDPKRRALGRGLDALLPAASSKATSAYGDKSVFSCAVEKLVPQKGQPRQYFAKDKIEELAQSIKEHGLLEPIVVRRVPSTPDKFEIIAGERRWRASQKAGLREVLVVVKDVSPKTAFELALIENVQREDLNPVELAEAIDRLIREHQYTQEALATRLGKDRTTITNSLRLLKLPATVRARVISGELSEGHARALLGADSKIEELAEKAVRGKLSVRAVEALVRGAKTKGKGSGKAAATKSSAIRDLEARLTRAAATKVIVKDTGNKGEVVIPYSDLDHLDRILGRVFKIS